MAIAIGDKAPDFTLPGVEGTQRRDYTLEEFRGSKVMLAFYPGDFTLGCTRQLCGYRDDFEILAPEGVVVLGISPQDIDSHERFIAAKHFQFPLLSDTDHKVIDSYGVGGVLPGISVRRAVFLVDALGVVRFASVKTVGATWPSAKKLASVLDTI